MCVCVRYSFHEVKLKYGVAYRSAESFSPINTLSVNLLFVCIFVRSPRSPRSGDATYRDSTQIIRRGLTLDLWSLTIPMPRAAKGGTRAGMKKSNFLD